METRIQRAERLMNAMGIMTQGIEYASVGDHEIAYVNCGDTYSKTICEENGRIFTDSWGNWLETAETEYEEETDTIQCGYCGEFTPNNGETWRETVCEYCGRNVATGEKV